MNIPEFATKTGVKLSSTEMLDTKWESLEKLLNNGQLTQDQLLRKQLQEVSQVLNQLVHEVASPLSAFQAIGYRLESQPYYGLYKAALDRLFNYTDELKKIRDKIQNANVNTFKYSQNPGNAGMDTKI